MELHGSNSKSHSPCVERAYPNHIKQNSLVVVLVALLGTATSGRPKLFVSGNLVTKIISSLPLIASQFHNLRMAFVSFQNPPPELVKIEIVRQQRFYYVILLSLAFTSEPSQDGFVHEAEAMHFGNSDPACRVHFFDAKCLRLCALQGAHLCEVYPPIDAGTIRMGL